MPSRTFTVVTSGLLVAVLAATAAVSQEARDGAIFLSEVETEGGSSLTCGSMPAYRMGTNVVANNTTASMARSLAVDDGCAATFHFMNTSSVFQFRGDARVMFHAVCSAGVDGGELRGGTFGYRLQKDGENLGSGIHWGDNTTGGFRCSGDPVAIAADGIPTGDASFAQGENLTLLIYARAGPSDPDNLDRLEILVADPWRPAALVASGLPLGVLTHPETGDVVAGPGDPKPREGGDGPPSGLGNGSGNATTGAGINMTANSTHAAAGDGEAAFFSLRLRNEGDANASFNMRTQGLPAGWEAEADPRAGMVAPNASKDVVLRVHVPAGTAHGGYAFEAVAGDDGSAASLNLTVVVRDAGHAPPEDENATMPSPAPAPAPPPGNQTALEPEAESPGLGVAMAAAVIGAVAALRWRREKA